MKTQRLIFVSLILAILLSIANAKKITEEHRDRRAANAERPQALSHMIAGDHLTPLNVHVIAHTHDDVGWLKTVDEYYLGANQSIQDAGVQYILDTVIQELQGHPDRKFIYVEIAFFIRWWREQTEQTKQIVRDLVAEKRLEFINGGWCMNDEANTDYNAIIDQMTQGHLFLFNEFGIRPTIGWHIDPFGHASTQAALFALMGFDAFFFGRIDWQDHDIRNKTQNLEFVWRGSQSLGSTSDIFSHVLYTDYCDAPGFAFDYGDEPINDDPKVFNYNVKQKADSFAAWIRKKSVSYRTNNILQTFGCDFQYQNAHKNFKNIDKLINYINSHPEYKLNMFYSTPSIYVQAVNSAGLTWSLNENDFFPYADDAHSYWSGYFTSRPALKGYVRSRGSLLNAVDKLFTTAPLTNVDVAQTLAKIDTLSQSYSVSQHHDAVAGTEKQHVAYDYALRLAIGTTAVEEVLSDLVGGLISGSDSAPSFEFCRYLNVSECPALDALSSGATIPVVAYNPVAWERNHYFRLPVPTPKVAVTAADGSPITFQIYPNADRTGYYNLVFSVALPPLGFTTVFISTGSEISEFAAKSQTFEPTADIVIENEFLKVTFSGSNNHLASIFNKGTGKNLQIDQEYLWYNGSTGNNDKSGQASGAYIFRPNQSDPFSFKGNPQITVTQGQLVSEVIQVWNSWLTTVTRLFAGQNHIEVEHTVGPIDISDGLGKEIISRYTTDLATDSFLFTDSEGLEMQTRKLNVRPTWNYTVTEPVAGNYYPMNTASFIKDASKGVQLTVVADRSSGVASLSDGSWENMIHRRLLVDDGRGVGEPLNESYVLRVSQLVSQDSVANSPRKQRALTILHTHQPVLLFSQTSSVQDWASKYLVDFQSVVAALPLNVHLLTLKTLSDGQVLLRLQHLFAVDEDPQYSQPVSVDLSNFFQDFQVDSLSEYTLSANRPLSELNRLHWKTKSNDAKPQAVKLDGFVVTLNPMQIRTFLVRLQSI